jgi:hypothetical protein
VDVPPDYHPVPFRGQAWQVGWALQRTGILVTGTWKDLQSELRNGYLWRKPPTRRYLLDVYVHRNAPRVRVESAWDELEKIKASPYHPEWHRLPRKYSHHAHSPLMSPSEGAIARVLHEFGFLREPTVRSLRKTMKNKKTGLFGIYEEGMFFVYLGGKFEEEVVHGMRRRLEEAAATSTPLNA